MKNNESEQTTLNVDLSASEDIVCTSCGNYTFVQVVLMKKLSALVSPTGKDAMVPIPVFSCNACGNINTEFLPPALRNRQKINGHSLDPNINSVPKLSTVE